jgi:hypothetical protein
MKTKIQGESEGRSPSDKNVPLDVLAKNVDEYIRASGS